ncbi:hypothetical protein SPURM210S_06588 [Streptomyces purpurascens]
MGDVARHSVAGCTPSGQLTVDVFQEFPASNRMALAHEGTGWHNNLDRITPDVEQPDAVEVSAHHSLVLAPQRAIDQYGTSSERCEPLGPLHRRFPAASGHEHHVDVDRLGCQTGNQSVASNHRPFRQALQRSAFPAVQRSGRNRLAEWQRHQEVQGIRSRQGGHTRSRPSLPLSHLDSVSRNDSRSLGFNKRQVRTAGYEISGSQRSRNHTQGLSCHDCHRSTRSRPAPDALPSRAVRTHPYCLPRATGSSLNNKASGPQPPFETGTRPNRTATLVRTPVRPSTDSPDSSASVIRCPLAAKFAPTAGRGQATAIVAVPRHDAYTCSNPWTRAPTYRKHPLPSCGRPAPRQRPRRPREASICHNRVTNSVDAPGPRRPNSRDRRRTEPRGVRRSCLSAPCGSAKPTR